MMILDHAGGLLEWVASNFRRSFLLVIFVVVVGFAFLVSRPPRH